MSEDRIAQIVAQMDPFDLPYFPMYVQNIVDAVQTWNTDRVGAYCLCLFYQWRRGGLPADDPKQLITLLHETSLVRTRKLWGQVEMKFERRDDGLYWNRRLEVVRLEVMTQIATGIAKGKAGADRRWGSSSGNARASAQAHARASAQAMPGQCNLKDQSTTPPLTPPSAEGGAEISLKPPTRREREFAEHLRSQRSKGHLSPCPHTPPCNLTVTCIGRIVQEKRLFEASGQRRALDAGAP